MSEIGEADERPLRLDQDVREALLRANEGFTDSTYYPDKNFREQRDYEISGGALHVRSRTKTSWADSRNESEFVADDQATHRFLRERVGVLDTDGVREEAAAIKAARKTQERAEREERASQTADATEDDNNADLNDYNLHDADEPATEGTPSLDVKWIFAGVFAIGSAIWVAPRAKKAWQTKGKPRLDEWRARRRGTDPSDAGQPGEGPEPSQLSNNVDD